MNYCCENDCPNLIFTTDEIRGSYEYDSGSPESVPQELEVVFEADSFQDAIRNAASIGGDMDTTAAIAASVAEAEWGVPEDMSKTAISYIDKDLKGVVKAISGIVFQLNKKFLTGMNVYTIH